MQLLFRRTGLLELQGPLHVAGEMPVVIRRSRPSSELPVQVNPKYAVTSTITP